MNKILNMKAFKFMLAAVLATAVIFAVFMTSESDEALAATTLKSGTCGTVSYQILQEGDDIVLEFTSSGTLEANTGSSSYPWYSYDITKVRVSNSNLVIKTNVYSERLFLGNDDLTDISGLANFDTSDTIDFKDVFYGCSSLADISPLEEWDVSNVNSFMNFFYKCSSLADISPLEEWDVSNVDIFWNFFFECSSLADISPLAGWDVSNGSYFWGMFRQTSIADISPLAGWDVSNGTVFRGMFYDCDSLVDASIIENWDMSNAQNIQIMFYDCDSLEKVSFSTTESLSQIYSLSEMFYSDEKIEYLDLSFIDSDLVQVRYGTFSDCSSLKTIKLGEGWNWKYSSYVLNTIEANEAYSYGYTVDYNSSYAIDSTANTVDLGTLPTPSDTGVTGNWVRIYDIDGNEDTEQTYGSLTAAELAANWTSDYAGTWSYEYMYTVSYDLNASSVTGSDSTVYDGSAAASIDDANVTLIGKIITDYDEDDEAWNVSSDNYVIADYDGLVIDGAEDYVIYAWNTEADGSGETYYANEVLSIDNALTDDAGETVTLYAQWVAVGEIYVSTNCVYDADEWTLEVASEDDDYVYGADGNAYAKEDVTVTTDDDGNAVVVVPATVVYPVSEGYTGYWTVIDEDTWVYTFYVYDDEATYYVWEDDLDGFEQANGSEQSEYVILDPYVTALDGESSVIATITNKDSDEDFGSLKITKKVTYTDGTSRESSSEFTVQITLYDEDGNLTGTNVYGTTLFVDGVATITLSKDETYTIENIPAGYSYYVEEIDVDEAYEVTYTTS